MKNLWEETIQILEDNGKTFRDVVSICGSEFQITKEDFEKYSKTYYDSGYGAAEVAEDLLVIGEDFWLERHEYDGSEWWEFKTMPKRKDLPFKHINALTVGQSIANKGFDRVGWCSLAQLNAKPKRSEVTEE
jgi:hypothetical protein